MDKSLKNEIIEWLLLTISSVVSVLGIYYFRFPNNFSFGGVTGLSVVLGQIMPLSPGIINMLISSVLLVVGFIFLGREFGIKTVYCSVILSAGLWVMEMVYPMEAPFTRQPLLELCYAVFIPAVGSALMFNLGASGGGTDILAMIMKKYWGMDVGGSLIITDIFIAFAACAVFGLETGLFSFLGLIIKSLVIDGVIESINLCKYFTVICDKPEPICYFITHEMHRSATYEKAKGAYTNADKYVIFTVVKRSQALALRNFIRKSDPNAFMMITNTSEIIGKNFRSF